MNSTILTIHMDESTYAVDRDILPELPWIHETGAPGRTQKTQIFYFALTTCAYCKRGLSWLQERGVTFSWLYLDSLPLEKKGPIKEWVKKKYTTNFGTPFIIFRSEGKDYASEGFDPDYWKAKIR